MLTAAVAKTLTQNRAAIVLNKVRARLIVIERGIINQNDEGFQTYSTAPRRMDDDVKLALTAELERLGYKVSVYDMDGDPQFQISWA